MSTPFYVVDHRVDVSVPSPFEDKHVRRRGAPEALRLSLPTPGTPLQHYQPTLAAAPVRDSVPGSSPAGWLARLFRGLRHAPA